MLVATAAHAKTWYLMAANEKVVGSVKAATVMDKGAVVGPVHFLSRGTFSSRKDCEAARREVLNEWRTRGVIAKGGWRRHGVSTANGFVQCITENDPRLKTEPGGIRSMNIMVNKTRHHAIRGR